MIGLLLSYVSCRLVGCVWCNRCEIIFLSPPVLFCFVFRAGSSYDQIVIDVLRLATVTLVTRPVLVGVFMGQLKFSSSSNFFGLRPRSFGHKMTRSGTHCPPRWQRMSNIIIYYPDTRVELIELCTMCFILYSNVSQNLHKKSLFLEKVENLFHNFVAGLMKLDWLYHK